MALIGNFSVLNKSAGKWLAGTTVAGASAAHTRAATNRASDWRKFGLQDRLSTTLKYTAKPNGYYPQGAWNLAVSAGGLSSYTQCSGLAAVTLSIVAGMAIAGVSNGVATASATGQLVSSGSGTAAGTSTATGSTTAALNATATTAGTSTTSAGVSAKGNATGSAAGTCTLSATRYATGTLAGSITPFTELSPQSLAAAVLDAENGIEAGLTPRQAMRLVSAAMAGKISGAEGSTITIRGVADDKDRIVATVDSNGNRTAIAYDVDE